MDSNEDMKLLIKHAKRSYSKMSRSTKKDVDRWTRIINKYLHRGPVYTRSVVIKYWYLKKE